jgi:hypothetical protein
VLHYEESARLGVIAQRSGERPVSHTTNGEASCVADEVGMVEAARNDCPVFCLDSKHRKRRRPAKRSLSSRAVFESLS